MSKFKLLILYIPALLFILGGVSQRHAIACELITFSNYSEISPNIFISSSFDSSQKDNLLSIIDSGKSRVNDTFGNMGSFPRVIIATTEEEASNFGSNAYGKALITPLGQCIVFGPKGQNVDVVAHEYTHAEVHFRVGWLNHFLNIPIWLNEGIALLVDYREPYLLKNINISEDEIDAVKNKGSNFFTGNNVLKNYQAARLAVTHIDKSELYENLEKLRQGQDITSVFLL